MARVYEGERAAPRPRARPGGAADLPAAPRRPPGRAGLEGLRADDARLQRPSSAGALRDPAHPGHPARSTPRASAPRPGTSPSTRPTSFVTNTNWQFYGGETTLSLLLADGRAGGAELRLGRGRHGRARRRDPRVPQPRRRRRSATSGRTSPARCSTSCCRSSFVGALVLVSQGVDPDARRLRSTSHDARAAADQIARPRPGRLAGSRSSSSGTNGGGFFNVNSAYAVREPDGVLELRRDALHPADPGRADRHLRAHGRQPPPGLGALRRDGGAAGRRRSWSPTPPSSTARRRRSRPGIELAAGDGTTGGNLEGKEQRNGIVASAAVGDGHDGRLERLGQLRPRLLHRHRRRASRW